VEKLFLFQLNAEGGVRMALIRKEVSMAVSAYVLIRVEADKTKSAFEGLTKLKEVKSAHTVTGPFDIILLVEGKNLHELGEVILSKVRGTDGVSRTMTCVTVEKG
jgi:DNA-binding Lrp family transcriptional regulator